MGPPPRWLIVYTCKVPAVVEGFKKIKVAFFEINDWINDCICNLNFIFYKSNILDVACFFCTPDRRLGRRLLKVVENATKPMVCWLRIGTDLASLLQTEGGFDGAWCYFSPTSHSPSSTSVIAPHSMVSSQAVGLLPQSYSMTIARNQWLDHRGHSIRRHCLNIHPHICKLFSKDGYTAQWLSGLCSGADILAFLGPHLHGGRPLGLCNKYVNLK